MKVFSIIILLTLTSAYLLGQESDQDTNNFADGFRHQFGAAAGFSTGYGLSYRYWPGNWGIQGTFAPYYDNTAGPTISLGITGLRLIEDNGWSRFFVYLGNHLHIDSDSDGSYDPAQEPEYRQITTYVLGVGPGIEFLIKRRLGINLMFGVALFTDSDGYVMTHLTGETGIYYRF